MKLMKQIWPRILLYAVLVLIIASSVVFWSLSEYSSLSENFLAGSIEIAVTVILIDGLLSLERIRRIKALNANNANASTYHLGFIIVRFMKEFDFPIKPSELETVGMSNRVLREKVNDFFESKEYGHFLQKLKAADADMLKKLKGLEKLITESSRSVIESIEKSQPYPDPTLIKTINDTIPSAIAFTRVMEMMYEVVEVVRKSEASDATLARELIDQEMEDLTSKNSQKNKSSVDASFRAFIDALLVVRERAERNQLHYDV